MWAQSYVIICSRVGIRLLLWIATRRPSTACIPIFAGARWKVKGLAEGVLERAGIREADGLAAVTNSDTLNAVVAHAAREFYNVPNVVARNYDPNLRSVIEAFGLQTVGSTYWGAQRVEELLMNPSQKMVYSAGNGEVEVYEVQIPEEWNGRTLGELLDPLKNATRSLYREQAAHSCLKRRRSCKRVICSTSVPRLRASAH